MEKTLLLSEEELKILKILRSTHEGEIRVIMKEKHPIRLEQIEKNIVLDLEQEI